MVVVEVLTFRRGYSQYILSSANRAEESGVLIYIYIYNWKKNSTDRHLAIINFYQLATDKSNQPLQIAIT